MNTRLTIEDILRRVVESGRHVKSYERSSRRVTTKDGEPTETESIDIRVGDDLYESSEPDDWMWREELTYRGKKYARVSTDSPWQTPEELGWVTIAEGTLKAEGVTDWDRSLFSKVYATDFSGFLAAVRLPDEIASGRSVIRLSISEKIPLHTPPLDEMMEKVLPRTVQVPDGMLDKFQEQLSLVPEGMDLREDLLIDSEDFRLLAVEVECSVYRAGEVIESFVETRSYSKFNEAELPGPLPD
jgi:hypothetical protein